MKKIFAWIIIIFWSIIILGEVFYIGKTTPEALLFVGIMIGGVSLLFGFVYSLGWALDQLQ